MALKFYWANVLIGGAAGALDKIPAANWLDKYAAITIESGYAYIHELDDDLGGTEASPFLIQPDDENGNKRLNLVGIVAEDVKTKTAKLYDTDQSNLLSLVWNEASASDYTLNLAVGGASRTLTLNENLTIGDGTNITITGVTAARTITLNENLTIGGGTDITITGVTAARTLTMNENLTVGDGTDITITGVTQANTLTLNESFIVGDGHDGTLTFSAASKILTVDESASISDFVREADFDADTFLYASANNTPVATSPANVLAALTSHAGAAFDWNSQNLTGVGTIGCGTLTTTGNIILPANGVIGVTDGNPQIVFDNANNWLEITGDVIVGGTSQIQSYSDLEVQGNYGIITMTRQTANTSCATLLFCKSRSGGVITSGDWLFSVQGNGHDGTDYNTAGARIVFESTGTIATDKVPTNILFQTAAGAAANDIATKMLITSVGYVGINFAIPSQALCVGGSAIVSLGMNVGDIINAPIAGGMRFARTGTAEPFILLENDAGNNGLSQIRGINGGGIKLTDSAGTTNWLLIDSAGKIGTGGVASPAAQLHVDQSVSDAAIPVLKLDQGDVSEQCIKFSSDATDRDINLFTVDVTGTPTLMWDESEDGIGWNKNLRVDGRVAFGDPPEALSQLYVLAPDAQAAVYCAIHAKTYSDAASNYGIYSSALGGGGTNNYAVFGNAANAGTNNYHFFDSAGNYADATGWHDVSDPKRKTKIRDITVKDGELFYTVLDKLHLKGYKLKAEQEEKNWKTPERFGLLANDPDLPSFLTSKGKEGISAGQVATYLIGVVQYQKELILGLEKRIAILEI